MCSGIESLLSCATYTCTYTSSHATIWNVIPGSYVSIRHLVCNSAMSMTSTSRSLSLSLSRSRSLSLSIAVVSIPLMTPCKGKTIIQKEGNLARSEASLFMVRQKKEPSPTMYTLQSIHPTSSPVVHAVEYHRPMCLEYCSSYMLPCFLIKVLY
jgi:hypothetical protein